MSLEVKGKFIKSLEPVIGEGANGQWKKQDFVIQTDGQYPKEIAFTLWGDKTDILANIKKDQNVLVCFDIESREYNGRYFTNAKAWKVDYSQNANSTSANNAQVQNQEEGVDLPF